MLKILCQNNKVAPINSVLSETKTIQEKVVARKRKPDNPHLLGCRHITNTDYKTQMELKRSRAFLFLNGLFFFGPSSTASLLYACLQEHKTLSLARAAAGGGRLLGFSLQWVGVTRPSDPPCSCATFSFGAIPTSI